MTDDGRPLVWCGIDPGLAKMGVAFLLRDENRWRAISVKTITTKSSDELHQRMFELHAGIVHRSETGYGSWRIRYVIESQEGVRAAKRLEGAFDFNSDRVERVVGMIWEHALMATHSDDNELVEVTPLQMRQCVGLKQNATKRQVADMVRRIVEKLPSVMSEHAFDACAAAIAGERIVRANARLRQPQETPWR